jgi:hypothetical protein
MRYFGIIWAAKSKPISKLEIFLILFFLISPVFWFSKISPLNEHIRIQFFVARYLQRKFMFILVLLDGFFVGFQYFDSMYLKSQLSWAFLVMYAYFSMHWLSQRGSCLSLAEPMPKRFHRWLSQCRTNFLLVLSQRSNFKSTRKWYI